MDNYIQNFLPAALAARVIWGGVIARMHLEPDCIQAMETWYAHVLRYSRRDQLSLPLAVNSMPPTSLRLIEADNFENAFLSWPTNSSKPDRYFEYSKSRVRKLKKLKSLFSRMFQ